MDKREARGHAMTPKQKYDERKRLRAGGMREDCGECAIQAQRHSLRMFRRVGRMGRRSNQEGGGVRCLGL
jgi:hypothetical protein